MVNGALAAYISRGARQRSRSCRRRSAQRRSRARCVDVGADRLVVMVNGALAAYISRGARQLARRSCPTTSRRSSSTVTRARFDVGADRAAGPRNQRPHRASEHPLAPYLVEAGFSPSQRWAIAHPSRRTTGRDNPSERPGCTDAALLPSMRHADRSQETRPGRRQAAVMGRCAATYWCPACQTS